MDYCFICKKQCLIRNAYLIAMILNRSLRHLSRNECIEMYIKSSRNMFVLYGAHVCCFHTEGDFFTIPESFTDFGVGISLSAEKIVVPFNQ